MTFWHSQTTIIKYICIFCVIGVAAPNRLQLQLQSELELESDGACGPVSRLSAAKCFVL